MFSLKGLVELLHSCIDLEPGLERIMLDHLHFIGYMLGK